MEYRLTTMSKGVGEIGFMSLPCLKLNVFIEKKTINTFIISLDRQ
jgi:hypothetical protein